MKMWWSADLLIILLWCFSLPIASGVSDYKHFHWQKLFSSDKDLLFQSPRRNVCGHLLSPFDHVGRLRCDNTSSDKGKKHFRMEYRDEDEDVRLSCIPIGFRYIMCCMNKQWKKEQASRCCTADDCLRQSVNQLYTNHFQLLVHEASLQI